MSYRKCIMTPNMPIHGVTLMRNVMWTRESTKMQHLKLIRSCRQRAGTSPNRLEDTTALLSMSSQLRLDTKIGITMTWEVWAYLRITRTAHLMAIKNLLNFSQAMILLIQKQTNRLTLLQLKLMLKNSLPFQDMNKKHTLIWRIE